MKTYLNAFFMCQSMFCAIPAPQIWDEKAKDKMLLFLPIPNQEHYELTMGSLFDGIGGFPLAASRHGIKTLWASEIEAFPMAVTKLHFPHMVHVGDITKLKGWELPPVDIIAGGSPCQDLSVASTKRLGLAGERSGLFMEQIRVIKEMREADIQRGRTAEYPVVPLSVGFHNRREGPIHRLAPPAQFFIQTIRRRNKNGKERVIQATIQADRM